MLDSSPSASESLHQTTSSTPTPTQPPTDARPGLVGQAAALAVSFMLAFVTAAVGATASINAPGFYKQLVLPSWAPPAWVFGPVWTTLYALMAMAAFVVWRQAACSKADCHKARWALVVYGIQLLVNGLWSWLFFAWRQGFGSLVDVLLLFVLIVLTVGLFWRCSRLAACLMLPYLCWVGFASALTLKLWLDNPGLLG